MYENNNHGWRHSKIRLTDIPLQSQGEKLVDRTVRLLKENGQNDIWVTVAQKGMYPNIMST